MNGAFEEQVRQRAYEIWTAEGRLEGRAHQHWLIAESDVLAGAMAAKPASVTKSKAKSTSKTKPARAKAAVAAAAPSAPALKARPAVRRQASLSGASA